MSNNLDKALNSIDNLLNPSFPVLSKPDSGLPSLIITSSPEDMTVAL